MDLPQLLFSFSGRLNREPYWLGHLALGVPTTAIALVSGLILPEMPEMAVAILSFGIVIATMWVLIALSVKRAHDRGRSGLFVLLLVVPLLGLWPLVELYFLRGTVGQNEYGGDPLGGSFV